MIERYYSNMGDNRDIACAFSLSKDALDHIVIIFAAYNCTDYEGIAFIVFEQDGKLYEVQASHCSWYGLEDQWVPEETDARAIAKYNLSWYEIEAQIAFRELFPDSVA